MGARNMYKHFQGEATPSGKSQAAQGQEHTSGIPADAQINLGADPWAGGPNFQCLRTFCQKYY